MKKLPLILAGILSFGPLSHAGNPPIFSLDFQEEIQSAPRPGQEIVESQNGGSKVEINNGERTEGFRGQGLRFNGKPPQEEGTTIVVPKESFPDFTASPFTIEMRVRFDEDCQPEGTFELVNKSDSAKGPGIRWYYTWKIINFLTGNGEGEDARGLGTDKYRSPIPFGEWLHLAVTRDEAGLVRMYLNGEEVAASEGDLQITPSQQPLVFGAYGNNYPFKGVLDEIQIFDYAKSPEEIRAESEVPASPQALQFDGNPGEGFWKDALVSTDFRIRDSAAVPSARTRAWMKHDDENVYLAVEASEPKMQNVQTKAAENKVADVYYDDSFEVMLDVDGNPEDFYHFLFNADGRKAQERRVQTGFVADPWANSAWDVRTHKDKGKWTAEVIIPWAILAREEGIKEKLGLKIVRNRRANDPNEITSPAEIATERTGRFLTYSAKGDLRRQQVQFGLPKLERIAQGADGKTLLATVTVPLKNHGTSPAELDLSALMQSRAGEASGKKESRVVLPPGQLVEETVEIPVGQPGEKRLRLSLRDAGGVTNLDFFPLKAEFVPVQLRILTPSYRNTFFPSQPITPVECRIRLGLAPAEREGAALTTELLDAQGTVLAKTEPQPAQEEQSQVLKIETLAEGTYSVRARLEKDGKEFATASAPLHKLPPGKGSEVYIDGQRRISLAGKPWLMQIMASDFFEGIETTGANAVLTSVFENSLLDDLQGKNLRAVVALVTGADINAYVLGKREYDPAFRKIIEERVNRLKDHPNLVGWFTFDEPDSFCHPELSLAIYRHIAELDPYHPVVLLNNTVRGLQEFAASADILTPDAYILPQKGGRMLRGFPYYETFLKVCAEVDDGTKAYGSCVQAFNYGHYGQFNGRAPTFVEQRCQDFLNFVLGAKMIYFYKFSHFDHSADLSIGVPAIISEINLLSNVLMEGEPDSSFSLASPEIKVLALKKAGQSYVIACNPTPHNVKTKISAPGVSELQVLSENRKIPLENGSGQDVFEPYATHLYTTDPGMTSPIVLQEIEKKIQAQGGLYFETPSANGDVAEK